MFDFYGNPEKTCKCENDTIFDKKLNQCIPKCDLKCGSGECLINFDFMGNPEKICKCGNFDFFDEKYRTCLPKCDLACINGACRIIFDFMGTPKKSCDCIEGFRRSEDETSCEPDVTTDAAIIAKLIYSKKAPKTMQEASTTKITYKSSRSPSTTTTVTTTTTTTVTMPPTTTVTTTVTTTATTTTTTVTKTSPSTKSFQIIPATTEQYLSQKIVLQEGNSFYILYKKFEEEYLK